LCFGFNKLLFYVRVGRVEIRAIMWREALHYMSNRLEELGLLVAHLTVLASPANLGK
jgi:hypothetical protein